MAKARSDLKRLQLQDAGATWYEIAVDRRLFNFTILTISFIFASEIKEPGTVLRMTPGADEIALEQQDDPSTSTNNVFLSDSKQSDQDHSHPHNHEHGHEHGHSHDGMGIGQRRPLSEMSAKEVGIRQFYPISPNMDIEEASYLLRTILSFKYYKQYAFAANHARMQNFYALPARQRAMLQPDFINKLEGLDAAIEKNAQLAKRIARIGEEMYLDGMEVKMGGPLAPKQKYAHRFYSLM